MRRNSRKVAIVPSRAPRAVERSLARRRIEWGARRTEVARRCRNRARHAPERAAIAPGYAAQASAARFASMHSPCRASRPPRDVGR
ncbi:hypothetical protein WS86_06575 [Burkholderia savannae]|nr:hypothetical protein WS86_06575 [Burkholderia savannae]KVK85473.1 hypothetical protein WS91_03820 [Burkholderia sp. MSMB1498]